MCLATPCKVIKMDGNKAIVESGNHNHEIDLSLLQEVNIGDYLLVHGDMAINKVPLKDAEKILKMIKEK